MLESSHNFYSMMQSSGNLLLVKGDLGKKKPGIHRLPPQSFSYGKSTGEDKEGAGHLISTWNEHKSSAKYPNEPDYRMLNSMSVANGFSTAPDFKTFRKGKDIRIHTSKPNERNYKRSEDMTYGLPLRPATPIKAVMSHFYGRLAIDNMHNAYQQPQPKTMRKWNSTRGFELLKLSKLSNNQSTEKHLFKMRKFSGVKSKTDCWREAK